MWGLLFVVQWSISCFHFSAQSWLSSSLFLSSLYTFWSWPSSCQPVLISGSVAIAGSGLQLGPQLVIPSTSASAPWLSLSRTLFLSWLFQSCVVPILPCVMFILILKSPYLIFFFSFFFKKQWFLFVCSFHFSVRIFSFSNLWKFSKVGIEVMLHLLLLLSLSDAVACSNVEQVARTFIPSCKCR